MILNETESTFKLRFQSIKDGAGSHSPSVLTLKSLFPELDIKIDACFLSNPYATELFMKRFELDFSEIATIRQRLEYYPSQNSFIAEGIAHRIDIKPEHIFVGNGAIEIIQAVIQNFVKQKLLVILPTFSSFYEFAQDHLEVVYFTLLKEEDFYLDLDRLRNFIKYENPDSIVIINPNNPNGNYINSQDLLLFIEDHQHLKNIIIDESFIHFAYEDSDLKIKSLANHSSRFENLIIIKSMSKDFGIAGIRAGYSVMSPNRVKSLLKNGYLWNSNGLSEYFFSLYSEKEFNEEYESVRKKYIIETKVFIAFLSTIENIKVYPSMGNFVLIEIINGTKAIDLVVKLLKSYGIYTRNCDDKRGLIGEFVRIASRSYVENLKMIEAIKEVME